MDAGSIPAYSIMKYKCTAAQCNNEYNHMYVVPVLGRSHWLTYCDHHYNTYYKDKIDRDPGWHYMGCVDDLNGRLF